MKHSFLILLASLQIISFAQTNTKANTGSGTYYNPAQYQDYVTPNLLNPYTYPSNFIYLNPDLVNFPPALGYTKFPYQLQYNLPEQRFNDAYKVIEYYNSLIKKVKKSNLSKDQKRKIILDLRKQKRKQVLEIYNAGRS